MSAHMIPTMKRAAVQVLEEGGEGEIVATIAAVTPPRGDSSAIVAG